MNEKLLDVMVLNGPILIHVVNDDIIITSHQKEVHLSYQNEGLLPNINNAINHNDKGISFEITSDIYDILEEPIVLDNFSPETIKVLLTKLLGGSIQYIAKIIKEEGLPVLLVNTYNKDDNYLLSTIGLVDDTRIIFAHINKVKRKDE